MPSLEAHAQALADNFVEKSDQRTLTTKVFQREPGKFRSVTGIGPSHIPDDVAAWKRGEAVTWLDIDTSFVTDNTGKLGTARTFYDLKVLDDGIGYIYNSKINGFISVRLVEIEGKAVSSVPVPRITPNKIFWDDVAPQLTMHLRVAPTGLDIFKRITGDQAPRSYTWEIEETDPPILALKTITAGWDNADGNEPTREGTGFGNRIRELEMIHAQSAFETPSPGIRRYRVTETWTGRTVTREKGEAEKKIFHDDCVYPVLIDQDVTESIVADNDDGSQAVGAGGNWQPTVPSLYRHMISNYASGLENYNGYRFQTVAIPQGATIDAATLTCKKINGGNAPFSGTMAGNDVDSAPAWANAAGPADMSATTATSTFSVPSGGNGTVITTDVITQIQEIVNRAGFASGNNIALGLTVLPAAGKYAYIYDYTFGSQYAVLTVDYTVGGATRPVKMASTWRGYAGGSGGFAG